MKTVKVDAIVIFPASEMKHPKDGLVLPEVHVKEVAGSMSLPFLPAAGPHSEHWEHGKDTDKGTDFAVLTAHGVDKHAGELHTKPLSPVVDL